MMDWNLPRAPSSASSASNRTFFGRSLTLRNSSHDETPEKATDRLGLTTLSDPADEAVLDLIFVHGLGGGAYSTWTKNNDPSLFWPKEFLLEDHAFQDVRVHTFGYDSNWKKESILKVHDFANELLGAIQDSPSIPQLCKTPLVFVAHSMGGLVTKRAFLLSNQYPHYNAIFERIRAIVFLATPHKGSELATYLKRIFALGGARPYVLDLETYSSLTQAINEEFPSHCQNLQLISFFETLPMYYGIGKGYIVERDSAVLGLANERRRHLHANHRDVAKYASKSDQNYITVRNLLAALVAQYREFDSSSRQKVQFEKKQALDHFLGVSDSPEDDLMATDSLRLPGSCEWILTDGNFKLWQASLMSQLYWLSGKPAAGKSILSGYIINHLREQLSDCCFYFFSHSDKAKSTINTFLRSMAWQMAATNPQILSVVLDLAKSWKDDPLGQMNQNTVWRKLYLNGILKIKLDRTQYWIVDATDECKDEPELLRLLFKVQEMWPVCIFVTSRNSFTLHSGADILKAEVLTRQITEADTHDDIVRYIEANINASSSHHRHGRAGLVEAILQKSNGCFLWVKLVLQTLPKARMASEIRSVLENVPTDMDELYLRILDTMQQAELGKPLAHAIIIWTVCASRPMTTDEMHAALQIHMNDKIDELGPSIEQNCGQLIYVDAQSRVQMVHQTARDFLLQKASRTEFAVERKAAHKILAMTCLRYLSGQELRGPRHRKLSVSNPITERSPFVAYAANHVFEHINEVTATDSEVLVLLARFLSSSNVLSWIEYIAANSHLHKIIYAGKVVASYLRKRAKHLSPLPKEIAILEAWSIDLIRVATKFGRQLLASPSSIYEHIPPFCPPNSRLRMQFAASSTRGISVFGLTNKSWDDCMSVLNYPRGTRLAVVACSAKACALGMSTGEIELLDNTTYQAVGKLNLGENVLVLQFSDSGHLLVAAGPKKIMIWDVDTWDNVRVFNGPAQCMSVAFADDNRLLLAAFKNNILSVWNIETGAKGAEVDWTEELSEEQGLSHRRPTKAVFGVHQNLLAVIYRGEDIILWDIERDTQHDQYGKCGRGTTGMAAGATTVWSLVFNPAPNSNLLAAIYSDGDLVLFDTTNGVVKETATVNSQIISSSPDGRTLALGDSSGTIQLFDFGTLKPLYTIRSEDTAIKSLTFSADSVRIMDIRGCQSRVWEPMALLRTETDEELSDTASTSTIAPETYIDRMIAPQVTAIACHPSSEVFYVGKDDGSVWFCDLTIGHNLSYLFSHPSVITLLLYDYTSGMITCVDGGSRITSRKVVRKLRDWHCQPPILDYRAGRAIVQILCSTGHQRILAATAEDDLIWSFDLDAGLAHPIHAPVRVSPSRHFWASHPNNPERIMVIVEGSITIYQWTDFSSVAQPMQMESALFPSCQLRTIMASCLGEMFLTMTTTHGHAHTGVGLQVWHTADLDSGAGLIRPVSDNGFLKHEVEYIIGSIGQRLIFLDTAGYVSSIDLELRSLQKYDRHFMVPCDWLSSNNDLMVELARNGDILFVKRSEVAIIKRGLDITDKGHFSVFQRRSTSPGTHRGKKSVWLSVPSRSY